jgi:hypothetical protein
MGDAGVDHEVAEGAAEADVAFVVEVLVAEKITW